MTNLFMIDVEGTELSPLEKKLLEKPEVGAVILFTANFKTMPQLQALTQSIHQLRPDIFVAVDHEGGEVQRFHRGGFSPAPALNVFGELYDMEPAIALRYAQQVGLKISLELLASGIDLNFAPVLDLHDEQSQIIGQLGRAFHATVEGVVSLASAFIQGMYDAGMPSVGKHFPGHGRCVGDSHLAYPVNSDAASVLRELDLKPFTGLIQQKKLDAVMAAHVLYPSIDPENQAGYSKIWLQTILRDELGFQGLVMSDCLSMKGADIGDMALRVNRSLEAGCDMLILCQQPREELLDFFNRHQFPQTAASKQRIEAFKQSMKRFS